MPLPYRLPMAPAPAPLLTGATITMTAIFTNAGQTLLATALQTPGAQTAITYVDISPGCGALASGVTQGVAATALPLAAALPATLASGQSLTVTDGVNSETVTTSGSVSAGATSIPITSWTPAHSYAANVTGIAPTPTASDVALYNATVRVAASAGSAGSNPGESLSSAYFDGTQATSVYMAVGYYGGSTATTTLGTGTLIAEDIQYWSHTLNNDSASFQLDSTV